MGFFYIWPNAGGGGGGGSSVNGANGSIPITQGASSVSVTFTNAYSNLNFAVVFSIKNTVDPEPIFLIGDITAQTTSGFTVTFNAPTDTANYFLEYITNGNV